MKLPSIRELVMLAPKPLRKLVRYQLLPSKFSGKLGRFVDEGRDPIYFSKALRDSRNSRPKDTSVRWIVERLWGGFSEKALSDLEAMKRSPASTPGEASEAARALGIWYASRGEYAEAYENAVFARVAQPSSRRRTIQIILETDCLFELGRVAEVSEILDPALERDPENSSLLLTKANTLASFDDATVPAHEEERLEWINRIFENAHFAKLVRSDGKRPLSIDNIRATPPACALPLDEQPLVSVLVPAYAAEETIRVAIRSIREQSWRKLEIIIVDDRSPDATYRVAQELAREDERVKAYQLDVNSGAYCARNAALMRATGEFVTIHDADDWSHPQKIETQMRHLLTHPEVPANLTEWVRCRPNLLFRGAALVGPSRLVLNHSSLLVRRKDALALGGWDEVRIAADSEFLRRLEAKFGLDSIPRLQAGVPFAFALDSAQSLTRQTSSHAFTLFHGVRRTYHESATHWRKTRGETEGWKLSHSDTRRAFPAPARLLSRFEPRQYDLLVIMDFAMKGGAFVSTLNYIQAAIKLGKRIAVFHWRRYDLNPKLGPESLIRELAQLGQVDIVAPADEVRAQTVIAGYPAILNFKIDLPPVVTAERFFIITNQMPARLYSGGDVQYDPREVAQNVKELFDLEPTWIPISELVRGLMVKDGRFFPIHSKTWTPLIDAENWSGTPIPYRGNGGNRPTIGRHARDHYTKWPETAEAIASAYCAERDCDVKLLGGAKIPEAIMGKLPSNWEVHPFGSIEAQDFLLGLDFFIHYPHEDYIEEFGRAVIEAMALGIPVILPPVFETTFGEGALYASPEEVWPLIERIWSDRNAWEARASAGLNFVRTHSDWSQLEGRLQELVH
jgi:glycosyltransferase involved in cell wall biosynthesis